MLFTSFSCTPPEGTAQNTHKSYVCAVDNDTAHDNGSANDNDDDGDGEDNNDEDGDGDGVDVSVDIGASGKGNGDHDEADHGNGDEDMLKTMTIRECVGKGEATLT
jgi:hypothetical protein